MTVAPTAAGLATPARTRADVPAGSASANSPSDERSRLDDAAAFRALGLGIAAFAANLLLGVGAIAALVLLDVSPGGFGMLALDAVKTAVVAGLGFSAAAAGLRTIRARGRLRSGRLGAGIAGGALGAVLGLLSVGSVVATAVMTAS